jgi:hypothetical protein
MNKLSLVSLTALLLIATCYRTPLDTTKTAPLKGSAPNDSRQTWARPSIPRRKSMASTATSSIRDFQHRPLRHIEDMRSADLDEFIAARPHLSPCRLPPLTRQKGLCLTYGPLT